MDASARPDWTLLQSFAAVARHGSLSAAARALGLSQPTLGRHVHALEQALGEVLFTRNAQGLEPTALALALVEQVQAMEQAAARLSLIAEGRSETLSGSVRITASVIVAHFLLPPVIARIRAAEPDIQIEIVPSDDASNLIFREADIAIRMFRPTQLDIVARHIAEQEMGLYAAPAYLDRHGRPECLQALAGHDLVGFDRSDLLIRALRALGSTMSREDFPVRCDDQAAHWHLVRAGCGIGPMQCAIAAREPGVERVLPGLALPTLPMWLAAPEALHRAPRIRRVWDMLADGLRRA